ncbi:NUMOD1 domain-containing DNA-binding protein [Coprobacillaceae bacterium CR2/5/TPMF4]|nr:NUMOD1 domain-containing DNA-binding protein [Coprobacillaceae bacterium CR2/5/TPMF4]
MANTHVSAVCLGKMKTAYDYYFSYNDYGDKLPDNILTYINTNNCFRRIAQYDLNGIFLNEYKSLSEARKIIGKNITMKGNTSYGYIWKYIDKNNKNTYKDKLKENELYF